MMSEMVGGCEGGGGGSGNIWKADGPKEKYFHRMSVNFSREAWRRSIASSECPILIVKPRVSMSSFDMTPIIHPPSPTSALITVSRYVRGGSKLQLAMGSK